ncbi:glycosyltransferase family 4 protein [Psychrobium sp. 1_MG-2023]|uniref:glycosyltransferase family 4 protein n=1 Tax=Psychrobium sp. 1_MG-2023 TaxID=3062624 RepID=UPI000C332616|nr:glycosyltransferase family 4 protein [Psychrobium sp. 1_MG-2023]MDP2561132.1 glycosyltransferase family 4 protein [Psychrobium sp. 1_MG-2023]PKF55108.1 glycosyl transferase family 1 [Alteromonadales bacterium alter-6D02]
MMKIALIGPTPPPNGGMAMQTKQLEQFLIAANHDVKLIATNAPYPFRWLAKIPILRAVARLFSYIIVLYSQLKHYQLIHLMANSGWSFYLFVMPVVYIANRYHIPVVLNYRGGLAEEFFAKDWFWIKGCLRRVDKIIVPSSFLQQVFAKYQLEAEVIPNMVDLSIFEFKEPQLVAKPVHIVVTRNLEAIYDNQTAIKGFAVFHQQFPNSKLSIAGSGEQDLMLKALVKELELEQSVEFVGRLNRQQIACLYQQADIMLNTSLVDNTPNSIIEALASGLLVVSSNVGGIPYLVDDKKHALLVDPQDPKSVAAKLNQLMSSPELVRKLAFNGNELVYQFRPELVLPSLEKLYREVM